MDSAVPLMRFLEIVKNLVGAKLTGEMKSLENGVTLVKVEALASTADVKT